MFFEWNPDKAAHNLIKHGVDFADAVSVLSDEQALTVFQDFADEDRYATIGLDSLGRVLVVIYTWRGDDTIRLISARQATRRERLQYEGDFDE